MDRLGRADVLDQQRHRAGAEVEVGFLQRLIERRLRHFREDCFLPQRDHSGDHGLVARMQRAGHLLLQPVVFLRREGVEHVGREIFEHGRRRLVENLVVAVARLVLAEPVAPRHRVAVAVRDARLVTRAIGARARQELVHLLAELFVRPFVGRGLLRGRLERELGDLGHQPLPSTLLRGAPSEPNSDFSP
jgi:hypothetical protein